MQGALRIQQPNAVYFRAEGLGLGVQSGNILPVAVGFGILGLARRRVSTDYVSHSLNSLKRVSRGLYRGALRGILGV